MLIKNANVNKPLLTLPSEGDSFHRDRSCILNVVAITISLEIIFTRKGKNRGKFNSLRVTCSNVEKSIFQVYNMHYIFNNLQYLKKDAMSMRYLDHRQLLFTSRLSATNFLLKR